MPTLPLAIMALGVSGAIATVAADARILNLVFAGVTALLFAFEGVQALGRMQTRGASETELAEASATRMGLVWAWGALALIVIYLGLLSWREWWHFFSAFAVAAVASFGLAAALRRDVAAGGGDGTMLKLGRLLAKGQIVGMAAAVIGLVVDGKVTRFMNPVKYPDWAGNNLFLFGAVALAVLSFAALRMGSAAQPAGPGKVELE